ncbi:hypothetical protein [Sphaerisporangium sp. NPDC051011]|uniref:hypothetical protein n=1 Tax=Sphaerisporangium sp. NPDC051011 TaxID=3155792 RepID=UPI00340492DB
MKVARRVLVSLATALALSGLLAAAPTPAQAAFPWPSVSPSPEHWLTKYGWTQQQATDWVNACAAGRFCTWVRAGGSGDTYELFQFYRCQEYSLSNWLGTTAYYNHQTVRVQLLGSRHEHLRYLSVGRQFITNWDAVWYINLCA